MKRRVTSRRTPTKHFVLHDERMSAEITSAFVLALLFCHSAHPSTGSRFAERILATAGYSVQHDLTSGTPGIAAHATMLRRSLSTLAGVATRAQAARAGCVANLNAPSYFSTVASSGLDQREKSDRLQHSRLAVAAAWRGKKCARLDDAFEVMKTRRARKTTGTRRRVSGDTRARRRRSSNRSTRACGPSSAHLGLFLDRHRVAERDPSLWFFSSPLGGQRLTRAPPPRTPPQATPPTSPRRAPTAARSPPR